MSVKEHEIELVSLIVVLNLMVRSLLNKIRVWMLWWTRVCKAIRCFARLSLIQEMLSSPVCMNENFLEPVRDSSFKLVEPVREKWYWHDGTWDYIYTLTIVFVSYYMISYYFCRSETVSTLSTFSFFGFNHPSHLCVFNLMAMGKDLIWRIYTKI